jgi:hypothetical protein
MTYLKKNIPYLVGTLGAASLVFVASGIIAPGMLDVLSGIGAGFSSNILYDATSSAMKGWLGGKNHPNALNHSIRKLFISAIKEALSNIGILYAESGASQQEKRAAAKVIRKVQKALEKNLLNSTKVKVDEPEVKKFLHSDTADNEAITTFVVEAFSEAGVSASFGQFLAQHLASQIQLCFGEGLKNPANHGAWVAFQRLLVENLQKTVDEIAKSQQEIKDEIRDLTQGTTGFSETEMNEIRQLKKLLQDSKQDSRLVEVSIDKGITEALKGIEAKEDKLIGTTTETNINVKELKAIAKRVAKKHSQMVTVIYSSLAVALVAVGVLTFLALNRPFTATVHVYGWEGRQHHPLDGKGTIALRLGDKVEKAEISRQGEAIFKKILPEYNRKIVPVAIVETEPEPYYLADSVILLRKNEACEVQVLLRGLEKLEGVITDENGFAIADATVWVAGIGAQTDARGYFAVTIPLEKQKRHQEVEIHKSGYIPYRNSAMPMVGGGECRIILRN